ncbi:gamma-glutamyltransferase [Cellvibrio sp. QJXJ]|uniref:gamma-glutamyltransferase n=1 Tax=Cellvibrio sp. QJXJ TaxID=2964606 RepID=UPI0021C2AF1A|nr:gamma-glutamyltransferase [Cellvibrio sp. QJXJ]UUA72863.1 gamma-glutamyltransferase [Cellvibrio sp. QJXJ]
MMKNWLFTFAALSCLIYASATAASTAETKLPSHSTENDYARVSADGKVAVATVNPYATQIAMDTVARGGNALDAAIAATFALGVVDGHNSGIGGGCFILVRLADGRVLAIDGREMAPAAATRDIFLVDGKANPELSRTGALAVGVPGSVLALDKLRQLGAALRWRDLILPSAELADKGFVVSHSLAERLAATAPNLAKFPASAAIYLDAKQQPWVAGSELRQVDLADTYRAIAKQGSAYFYQGDFARKTERWMQQNGGLITRKDFSNYQIKMRKPIVSEFAGYTLYGFPPPSSGGTHVAQILNILEQFDLEKTTTSERYHLIAEAMKFAFADRAHWLGDADFTRVPRGLTDKNYARSIAQKISLEKTTAAITHGNPEVDIQHLMNKHTTHIAAADLHGNWVAITSTVNTSFGSKVVIPGTGVVLNNQMDDFSAQVGAANAFGLVGSDANAVAAKKRPLSSMSPTLVFKGDQPVMTLGAAGGPTIISQVVQTLLYRLQDNMPLAEAMAQPRIHQQWNPNQLFVEARMPQPVQEALQEKGHNLKVWSRMGASQAIELRDGKLIPVAEPRVIEQNSGR